MVKKEYNYGPTITDLPLRQIYYFGDNRPQRQNPLYGILASYDDMWYTKFWRGLELTPNQIASKPESQDLQPLFTGEILSQNMLQMVQMQLNEVHFSCPELKVPKAVKGFYMNWDLNPPCAGYHVY